MKKLILLFLFTPLISFGQSVRNIEIDTYKYIVIDEIIGKHSCEIRRFFTKNLEKGGYDVVNLKKPLKTHDSFPEDLENNPDLALYLIAEEDIRGCFYITASLLDYAGKVMGLASYFEKTKDNEEFYYEMVGDYKKIMTALPDYQAWLSGYHFQKLNEQSNPARAWENGWNDPESERKEIWTEKEEILHCAAVQRASNEVLYDQVNSKGLQKKIEGAGNNLVISGGNAMNVITNTYVKDNKDYNVFVPPDPGDSGLSFGMSVWKAEQLGWKGYSHNKRPSRRQCDITFDTRYLGDGLKKF